MSWPQATISTIRRLESVQRELQDRYVDRETAARLLVLATVCREHLLLLGPPGTAKTGLADTFCRFIGARQFRYLLTRFTEPSEIFGPVDLAQFEAGTFCIQTQNMLPTAEIAFLDEVFQGSSAILNTLLTLLNERRFHNGGTPQDSPLISLYGASAALPDDPALLPFSDRFLLRLEVAPVGDDQLGDLLDAGWEHERAVLQDAEPAVTPLVSPEQLRALAAQVRHVELKLVKPVYHQLIQELRRQGVIVSDRRVVRGLKLVAAACLLRQSEIASSVDLWPLRHFWTSQDDAALIADAVSERIDADPAAPARPARTPEEILAAADFEAERLTSGRFTITDGAITAALTALGRLRRELLVDHPDADAAVTRIERLIDDVTELYETKS
jgi:MoxR-like ATPase